MHFSSLWSVSYLVWKFSVQSAPHQVTTKIDFNLNQYGTSQTQATESSPGCQAILTNQSQIQRPGSDPLRHVASEQGPSFHRVWSRQAGAGPAVLHPLCSLLYWWQGVGGSFQNQIAQKEVLLRPFSVNGNFKLRPKSSCAQKESLISATFPIRMPSLNWLLDWAQTMAKAEKKPPSPSTQRLPWRHRSRPNTKSRLSKCL